MKKSIVIFIITALLLSSSALAGGKGYTPDPEFRHSLEVAVLPVFWANLDARYEYACNDLLSIFGTLGYAPAGSPLLFSVDDSELEYSFGSASAGVTLYPAAPSNGLYFQLGGDLFYFIMKNKQDDYSALYTRYVFPEMMIGWKWIISERAILRIGGGSGFGFGGDMPVGKYTMDWKDIQSRFVLNLGFLF